LAIVTSTNFVEVSIVLDPNYASDVQPVPAWKNTEVDLARTQDNTGAKSWMWQGGNSSDQRQKLLEE